MICVFLRKFRVIALCWPNRLYLAKIINGYQFPIFLDEQKKKKNKECDMIIHVNIIYHNHSTNDRSIWNCCIRTWRNIIICCPNFSIIKITDPRKPLLWLHFIVVKFCWTVSAAVNLNPQIITDLLCGSVAQANETILCYQAESLITIKLLIVTADSNEMFL